MPRVTQPITGRDFISFIQYHYHALNIYYLFEIVSLYPDARIGFVIGVYLIAIAIFVLIARLVRAILNQKGNVFERGLYSWIFIIVLGIVYFVLLTLVIKNLGYFSA